MVFFSRAVHTSKNPSASTPPKPSSSSVGLPLHIGIIMDGNGRWAQARGLPRMVGHQRGAETLKALVRDANQMGLRYLTVYAFSSENWSRPFSEINGLMNLLRRYIQSELAAFHQQNIRLKVIGERHRLALDIQNLIANAEAQTHDNTGLTIVIALNYGGRADIVQAMRQVLQHHPDIKPEDITESLLNHYLLTQDIPDPDVIIRTSGVQRLSNFLLWQSSYAELVFLDKMWPDFTIEDLKAAIADFNTRSRRFGGL